MTHNNSVRFRGWSAGVLACAIGIAGCGTIADSTTAPLDPAPAATAAPAIWPASDVVALDTLDELEVKGRAPKTGYERDLFGDGWVDVDANGCFTRSDILLAQLYQVEMDGPCKVVAGLLEDPYTGTSVVFTPGDNTTVQIDHVVALSDSWQKGSQAWSYAKRVAFANDPLNLLAVDAGANQAKGDGDAATWLPPNKAFRCTYVARQVAVKLKYDVWVTQAELEAMRAVLEECPEQLLPAAGDQPTEAAGV